MRKTVVPEFVTMVNVANNSASVLPSANGDATGIALQPNSGEIYTIEGSQFYIYDQSGNSITSTYNTDVKGRARTSSAWLRKRRKDNKKMPHLKLALSLRWGRFLLPVS